MTTPTIHSLDHLSVIDVTGQDADTIVHNLTTNEVKSLEVGEGRETFITDVRGKTLGHSNLYRLEDRLRLIGPAGQSEQVAAHIDRYTIREDATASIRDDDFVALVISSEDAPAIGIDAATLKGNSATRCSIGEHEVDVYPTRWLGAGTIVILIPREHADSVRQALPAPSVASESDFHQARTLAGFPWYGIDLDETNLPQEADRDDLAISFTKGCYLGQETVARLDALGQVQRKLVRWKVSGVVPQAGATLVSNEKTVGRLTSLAVSGEQQAVAIGFARRSHFDAGSTAEGIDQASGQPFTGTVL